MGKKRVKKKVLKFHGIGTAKERQESAKEAIKNAEPIFRRKKKKKNTKFPFRKRTV